MDFAVCVIFHAKAYKPPFCYGTPFHDNIRDLGFHIRPAIFHQFHYCRFAEKCRCNLLHFNPPPYIFIAKIEFEHNEEQYPENALSGDLKMINTHAIEKLKRSIKAYLRALSTYFHLDPRIHEYEIFKITCGNASHAIKPQRHLRINERR